MDMNLLNVVCRAKNICLKVLVEKVMTPCLCWEDTKSDELSLYVCFEGKSSQSEYVVEGVIESRTVGLEGAYKEMQRNYCVLEIVADRVIALPQTLERRNTLTEVKLAKIQTEFSVPPSVGLRQPTTSDVTTASSVGVDDVGQARGNFRWVQANCQKAKKRVYFISHLPSSQKSWRNRWCMAYGDWECPLGKTVTKHVPSHFQSIGSVKWGPISQDKEDEVQIVGLLLSETDRDYRNLVTPKNLLESELLQGSVVKGLTKVVVTIDEVEKQKWLKASRAKKAEKKSGR
ncbi:unnamed protein product [Prunus armeniaca]